MHCKVTFFKIFQSSLPFKCTLYSQSILIFMKILIKVIFNHNYSHISVKVQSMGIQEVHIKIEIIVYGLNFQYFIENSFN